MSSHLAAVVPAKGQPYEIRRLVTPKPGPGELLIAVKSVAINPADGHMRNTGLFIPAYPTVVGFDFSGVVIQVGDNVPDGTSDDDSGLSFKPGTRVAAYAACFWRSCKPEYGAFQERCLVPWQHAVPLPNQTLSWNQAATLPVAVQVPLSAWDVLGIIQVGDASSSISVSTSSGKKDRESQTKEALLVWGASSSVGTMGVQTARLIRDDPKSPFAAVYATAGTTNAEYVTSLGADRVFDYKDPRVVDSIVSAAKDDGLVIRHCFLATGQLALCQAVIKASLACQTELGEKTNAKIASAPLIPSDAEAVQGVEVIFLQPSAEEEVRLEQFRFWMGKWLRQHLANGAIKPSPEPTVLGKGLELLNAGLDKVLEGVNCTKLIVEVDN